MARNILYQDLAQPIAPPAAKGAGWQFPDVAVLAAAVVIVSGWSSLPFRSNIPTAATPHGWEGQQLVDYSFTKPFPVSAQQYDAMPWQGLLATAKTPHGWEGWQLDYKFVQPFPVTDQLVNAFEPSGFIGSKTPEGWQGQQYELKFAPPFPVVEQQYTAHFLRLIPKPEGWRSAQFDYRYSVPFPVASQQYADTERYLFVAFVFDPRIDPRGQQYEYRFAKSFPVEQQQYEAPRDFAPIPIFLPPGSGKRYKPPTDYLPEPAWDEKPNKAPVRPIWDRPQKPTPEAEPAPPPAPPPLPPLSAFAERGPPRIMRKLNLPSFNELIPPNAAQLNQRMPEVMDESDAIAALRALGIIKDS